MNALKARTIGGAVGGGGCKKKKIIKIMKRTFW